MNTIRNAITILIVFHLSGIVVGLNLAILVGIWLVTLPLGFIQDVLGAFYMKAVEDSVEELSKDE